MEIERIAQGNARFPCPASFPTASTLLLVGYYNGWGKIPEPVVRAVRVESSNNRSLNAFFY